ncbi:MAG: DUF1800 domain-containing protein [Pirellulales bacterium]
MGKAREQPVSQWDRYQPDDDSPWNLRRVVHLHRRAGFAATWAELARDLKDGPEAAIERLLDGKACDSPVGNEFEAIAGLLGDAVVASDNPPRLKAWWLYRMLFSPDPLAERLALMWHNHFATSNRKVQSVALMREQNDVFRRLGRGRFGELVIAVVKHPAMLVWLDADSNRKEHPNENLARELMELFTLGVGNYTENDVKEAARALTGWTVRSGEFREVPEYHDLLPKTILGQTGDFAGDDLLRMLLGHAATSGRLARRICELLMGDGVAGDEALDELGAGLREHDLNVGWAIETVLRSNAFFSEANIGSRVQGPMEFMVGAARALELFDPPPSTLLLAEWGATLGQDLFHPPTVFGWTGGRGWINTRSVIARTNFAGALADGSLSNPSHPPDLPALARRRGAASDPDGLLGFFAKLLFGVEDAGELSQTVGTALAESNEVTLDSAGRLVAALLGSSRAQLA